MPHSVNSQSTMSRPSSASASSTSANAFPKPAGTNLGVPDHAGSQLSPVRSTFSFEDSAKSPSPHDSASEKIFDSSKLIKAISHGAPGEKKETDPVTQRSQNYHSRRRTQYYEEQFAYKDATGSARERVTKDSPIIAELRTNVIIKDEYTVVTDMSYHLSTRYQRPESSIMITVDHSACLLLGGSFEPTYVLTISALPVQVQPTTNKRNASLIQTFMCETLGVPPDRGIIKFMAIPEENFATNGNTVFGEIERMEKQQAEENGGGLKRALTKSSRRSGVTKAKSSIQLSRNNSKANGRAAITPPIPSPGPFEPESFDEKTALGDVNELSEISPVDSKMNRNPSMKKKPSRYLDEKTTMKSATNAIPNIPPPPIPEDAPTPKVGKRKSFAAIFRR